MSENVEMVDVQTPSVEVAWEGPIQDMVDMHESANRIYRKKTNCLGVPVAQPIDDGVVLCGKAQSATSWDLDDEARKAIEERIKALDRHKPLSARQWCAACGQVHDLEEECPR